MRPTLEALLKDQDQDSQRAGAEFLGGVLNGGQCICNAYIHSHLQLRLEALADGGSSQTLELVYTFNPAHVESECEDGHDHDLDKFLGGK